MKEGDIDIRITPFMKSRTKESQDLGTAFDTMAQEIQNDRVALLTRLKSSTPDETLEDIENTNLTTEYADDNNTIGVVDNSSSRRLMLTGLLVKAGYMQKPISKKELIRTVTQFVPTATRSSQS